MNKTEGNRIDKLQERMGNFECSLLQVNTNLTQVNTTLGLLQTNHLPHIQGAVDDLRESFDEYTVCSDARMKSLQVKQDNLEDGLKETNKHLSTIISILGFGFAVISIIIGAAIAIGSLMLTGVL